MALLEQVSEQLRAGADRFLALPIVLQVVLALGAAIVITYVRLYPWQKATSSIRNLPGPVPKSFLFGSMLESSKAACGSVYDRWQTEAGGPTLRYSELLGGQAVFTADPVAVGHILQHSYTFVKPDFRSLFFSRVTGHGVLVAEGDAHRRQRRVLNPAFTQANIRDMMPIFYRMAYKLDGMIAEWVAEGSESLVPTPVKPEDKIPGTVPMDVNRWLAKLTLDVIALAGFGYEFDTLTGGDKTLSQAFHKMMSEGQKVRLSAVLHHFFWFMRWIPSETMRILAVAKAEADRASQQLINNRRKDLESQFAGNIEKSTDVGKDVLSIVLKANMSKDARDDLKLRDSELQPQIVTFILAGSETSSTVLAWLLWRLAHNQDVQDRLRAELQTLDVEQPELEQLNSLPYLENVVREGLRMDSAVPAIDREATKDIVIPLGTPMRGIDGTTIDHIKFTKGMRCLIPIVAINRSTEIWGPDAGEFNPDRHDDSTLPKKNVPGVYGSVLSFNGGARNCIGWRLALAEMKAILYVLIRHNKFELLPSRPNIEQRANFIMRPRVVGQESVGVQLPLLVRRLE